MSPSLVFLVLLLLSPFQPSAASSSSSSPVDVLPVAGQSAYDILAGFNFPAGLLPQGATGYELDPSTGRFRAYFNGTCSFSLEGSYQLKYKSVIGGYISENRLTQLTGVSVKILFLWLNIVEVVRSGDDIDFSVGIASASFGIDNFFVCPRCGCGLDCGGASKPARRPFVSSI
ncbi:unnamed protein product [Linum trigynum]|uniref:Uncharacterized protein n=1 Tax=Linum trigynum TaxID=586398 RepID=A0AAV2FLT6_9ROSI